MKKSRFSLLYKALLVVLFILLPILVGFIHSYRENRGFIRQYVLDDLTVLAEAYEGQVYQFLEMGKRRAVDFASDGFISESLETAGKKGGLKGHTLSEHLVRHKKPIAEEVLSIIVMDLEGKVVASTDAWQEGKDYSREPFFLKGLSSTGVTEMVGAVGQEPVLAISTPVGAEGDEVKIGVLANFISLSDLNRVLSGETHRDFGAVSWEKGRRGTMEEYIVNSSGLMLTESKFVKDAVLKQRVDTEPVRACIGSGKEVSGFYTDYRGVEVAGASMCIPSMGWTLLVEYDATEALAPVRDMRNDAAITAVAVAVFTLLALFVFIRSVLLRLRRLAYAAEDVAKGDYDTAVKVETNDEIGVLSDSFNRMAGEINKRTRLLAESEERVREAQRIGRMGSWSWDIVENTLYWSDEIYNIFGLEPREFGATYEAFLNTVHPEDVDLVKAAVEEALSKGGSYSIDHRVVRPDGSVRYVHEEAGVVFCADGKPLRMAGTVQDVTEKRAEVKQRRKLQGRLEDLLNNISAGVYRTAVGGGGGFVDVNSAMVNILEAGSREELLGYDVRELYEDKERREAVLEKITLYGFVKDEEIQLKTLKGNKIWVSSSAVLNRDEDGTLYIDGIVEEITEKKRLEEELIHAQRMEAVGQLAGGIAHDFNNILTAVNGYANLLMMKAPDNAALKGYAENILTLSDKAATLTQGLLAFSRKQVLKVQPTDLNDLVKRLAKILRRVIGEQISIKTELDGGDIIAMIDPNQIEQVIMNLATNARDAMASGGTMTITTFTEELGKNFVEAMGYGAPGRHAVIRFSDTGEGISPELMEKVFEPFFTTKEVGKGTGLGLAMVYGIVKQHNGYVDLKSQRGKGTTFTIHLPLAGEGVKKNGRTVIERPVGGTETILLAEDEPDVRVIMRTVLEEFGYTVVEAQNGEEAVARYVENKDEVRLLIMDVIMPKKNGQEAYEEIRLLGGDVTVLFVSGYATDNMREMGAIRDDMEFLSKPVIPSVLLKKVREVLDR